MRDILPRHILVMLFALNFAVALLIFLKFPALAKGEHAVFWAYTCVPIIFIGPMTTVLLFFIHEHGPWMALIALLGHGVAIVIGFAGIYEFFGLNSGGAHHEIGWATALYFSVVTWTTLGYGDFSPPEHIRLIAALQAILGMIYFGSLVGIFVNVVAPRLNENSKEE